MEDRHFTPWLQENIEILGNVIGIDIADAETEVPIGNYRLDILAYEAGSERKIAIENQYGTTNHTHLGQLITYMAGINAEVVVWIAENFNTEHITAINHLNQISNEEIAFFCIKPRLIKIDDSKPAFEFLVVAKPDEWEKRIKSETKISTRQSEYKKFWAKMLNKLNDSKPGLTKRKYCLSSWMPIPSGNPKVHFEWLFRGKPSQEFLVALHFENGDYDENMKLLDYFKSRKKGFENEFPNEEIIFDEHFFSKWTQIYIKRDSGNIDDDNLEWGFETMMKFYDTLKPILNNYFNRL